MIKLTFEYLNFVVFLFKTSLSFFFKRKILVFEMEFDILDSLDDIGYPNCGSGDTKVKTCIEIGAKSIEFTQLVEYLSKELQNHYSLESCVNAITDPEDSSSFLLEVSSFLKELQCPYKSLLSGSISQRLQDIKSRKILLDFLCTEVQAARLLQIKKRKTDNADSHTEENTIISTLLNVSKVLSVKCEENDNPLSILFEIEKQISSNERLVLPPAFEGQLTKEQWSVLTEVYEEMFVEYTIRRELLLTRLDVTLQSFKWGERGQSKETEILNAYVHKRKKLKKEPAVKITDLIASRQDIFHIEKTSSAELVRNTKSYLKKILIDQVPDRGGRPKEQKPPTEMPNWSKRSAGGEGRGNHRSRGSKHHGRGKKFKDLKGSGSFDAAGSY